MTRNRVFFPLLLLTVVSASGWAENKILYLTNGDTIEGEIVGETDERISLRLDSGVTISINQDEVDSVETAESIAEMEVLPFPGIEEPIPDLNLRNVFETIDPTPTPIPIKRLGSLKIRKKFRVKEYRATLIPKSSGKQISEPVRALPVIPEQDEEGNRNSGVITYMEPAPKIREGGAGWEVCEMGQLLNPGDEIATLDGRIEITTQKGNLIRLNPNSELVLDRNRSTLRKGKTWVQSISRNSAAINFGNVGLRLQPGGLIHVETLRSGHKISVIEGQIRLNNQPETPRLVKSLKGPISVWVDGANVLTTEKEIESVISARWEAWQNRVLESGESNQGFGDGLPLAGDSTDEKSEKSKGLLIEVASALSQYCLDNGSFPEEQPIALQVLVTNPGIPTWKGPYLQGKTIPIQDPWERDIVYRVLTENGETVAGIYITGPNGNFEEGEGDDMGILIPVPERPGN